MNSRVRVLLLAIAAMCLAGCSTEEYEKSPATATTGPTTDEQPVGGSTRTRETHEVHGDRHSMWVTATGYCSRSQETQGDPFQAAWGDRLVPGEVDRGQQGSAALGLTHRVPVWIEVDGKEQGPYLVLDKMAKRWRIASTSTTEPTSRPRCGGASGESGSPARRGREEALGQVGIHSNRSTRCPRSSSSSPGLLGQQEVEPSGSQNSDVTTLPTPRPHHCRRAIANPRGRRPRCVSSPGSSRTTPTACSSSGWVTSTNSSGPTRPPLIGCSASR